MRKKCKRTKRGVRYGNNKKDKKQQKGGKTVERGILLSLSLGTVFLPLFNFLEKNRFFV